MHSTIKKINKNKNNWTQHIYQTHDKLGKKNLTFPIFSTLNIQQTHSANPFKTDKQFGKFAEKPIMFLLPFTAPFIRTWKVSICDKKKILICTWYSLDMFFDKICMWTAEKNYFLNWRQCQTFQCIIKQWCVYYRYQGLENWTCTIFFQLVDTQTVCKLF